jgi:hypothetical protein
VDLANQISQLLDQLIIGFAAQGQHNSWPQNTGV